jgi:hypothetical protein
VPDADSATLKPPGIAAIELADAIADLLPTLRATVRRAS